MCEVETPKDYKTTETFLKLLDVKIQELRIDRQENLKMLAYLGGAFTIGLGVLKVETIQDFNKVVISFSLGFVFVASLTLGALGAAIVWFYTRSLHQEEIKLVGCSEQALDFTHAEAVENLSACHESSRRRWETWKGLYRVGTIMLGLSGLLAFLYLVIGVMMAKVPPV